MSLLSAVEETLKRAYDAIKERDAEIAAKDAEIERLQNAIGPFGFRDNWGELSIDGSHAGWIWNHAATTGDPFTFVSEALEPK